MKRLLVVTVCPRESGTVRLPVERGGPARRLGAQGIFDGLGALVRARGLDGRVRVREGCAGGCHGAGPNVNVEIYAMAPAGHRQDRVAVGWKTYVYSLGDLACLADVIDENVQDPPCRRRAGTRAAR